MSDAPPAGEEATATQTIPAMVLAATREREGTAVRYREGREWAELSYEDLGRRVREIARGLIALGVEPGDRVAIFSDTRVEWTLCDLGALCAGAVVAPIYHTNSSAEARHVLEDSGARVVFCGGRAQQGNVEEVREELSALEHVVLFEGGEPAVSDDEEEDGPEEAGDEDAGDDETDDDPAAPIALERLIQLGEEIDEGQVDERVDGLSGDDLFSLIYTSSTTGVAKGCMLTHANYQANREMIASVTDIDQDSVTQIGLPLAHTLTRMMQMVTLGAGAELAFWSGDRERLIEDLSEHRPTHYPAAPRVFEKIYNHARAELPPEEGAKGAVFAKLLDAGRRAQDAEHAGKRRGPLLALGHGLADNEILSDVRELFGDRLRMAITGAAPAPRHVLDFFYACGVLVLEGYGLTESSTAVSLNDPEDFRLGTVGRPLEGTEIALAEEDSEVLVRGPQVFRGYWNDEEATGEVLDEDGWLHTGDVGSFDEDGFLSITGRKKDILVTSSGENVPAPAIEARIAASRWVSNAVVYGNDKNYVVALVTIDEDERDALGEETGTRQQNRDLMARQMTEDDNVRLEIQEAVDEANRDLAHVLQVKKFAILDHDLAQQEDEITPTMKIKRDVVYERYRDVFEGLYEDDEEH